MCIRDSVSTVDISGDNYDILGNPNGTEGNMTWDVGEVLTDYGSDGCTDKFESGDSNIPCLDKLLNSKKW